MAAYTQLLYILLKILCFSQGLYAFNLFTKLPIVKSGPADSFFGFSVEQHQTKSSGASTLIADNIILVGAPRDNSSQVELTSIERPGAVYRCPISTEISDCRQLDVDLAPTPEEDKSNQWFGVTISSQGPGGVVATCAHRLKKSQFKWGFGMCLILTEELNFRKHIEPCEGKPVERGHLEYGYCQAGSSLDLSPNGDLLLGLPGVGNWRGSLLKSTVLRDLNADKKSYISAAQPPDAPVDINSYLGLSTTYGQLINGQDTFVAGAPRSENSGQVVLFVKPVSGSNLEWEPQYILSGKGFGSMFGYAVVVIDLNSDGLDDLVVGAPYFVDKDQQQEKRAGGAIYVYLNGPAGITDRNVPKVIFGRKMTEADCAKLVCDHAQFGLSLANLGDIDNDGYEDLAVGAPFEGNGAVYIYRGSPSGITEKYSQRIESSDLVLPAGVTAPSSFGYSLSGGRDLDNNKYNDLLVGAFQSNTAILLRAQPILKIEAIWKNQTLKIDPHTYECSDGTQLSCALYRFCFKYTEPTNSFKDSIRMKYTFTVDSDSQIPRLKFANLPADNVKDSEIVRTVDLTDAGQETCETEIAYVKNGTKEILRPIPFMLKWELVENPVPQPTIGGTLPRMNDYPVIDSQLSKDEFIATFVKKCGKDELCHSDLRVFATFKDLKVDNDGVVVLKLGKDSEVFLDIDFSNIGEPAYLATLTITYPPSFSYVGVERRTRVCTRPIKDEPRLVCDMDNPYDKGKAELLTIKFATNRVTPQDSLVVEVQANTTSFDVDGGNNKYSVNLRPILETDMLLRGGSAPEQLFYSGKVVGEFDIKHEEQIGKEVNHTYEVVNNGSGTVERLNIIVQWPYEVANNYRQGKHLLYLVHTPIVEGTEGKCHMKPGQVNPLGIISNRTTPTVTTTTNNGNDDVVNYSKRRRKREMVVPARVKEEDGRKVKVVTMDCLAGTAKCLTFNCSIGKLTSGNSSFVRVTARLWNSTFVEDYADVDYVEIFSYARLEIPPELNIIQLRTDNDDTRVKTKAEPRLGLAPKSEVAWWIIAVAVAAGILLLVILILVLWKLGFFKRRRPEYEDMNATHAVRVEKKTKYDKVASDDF